MFFIFLHCVSVSFALTLSTDNAYPQSLHTPGDTAQTAESNVSPASTVRPRFHEINLNFDDPIGVTETDGSSYAMKNTDGDVGISTTTLWDYDEHTSGYTGPTVNILFDKVKEYIKSMEDEERGSRAPTPLHSNQDIASGRGSHAHSNGRNDATRTTKSSFLSEVDDDDNTGRSTSHEQDVSPMTYIVSVEPQTVVDVEEDISPFTVFQSVTSRTRSDVKKDVSPITVFNSVTPGMLSDVKKNVSPITVIEPVESQTVVDIEEDISPFTVFQSVTSITESDVKEDVSPITMFNSVTPKMRSDVKKNVSPISVIESVESQTVVDVESPYQTHVAVIHPDPRFFAEYVTMSPKELMFHIRNTTNQDDWESDGSSVTGIPPPHTGIVSDNVTDIGIIMDLENKSEFNSNDTTLMNGSVHVPAGDARYQGMRSNESEFESVISDRIIQVEASHFATPSTHSRSWQHPTTTEPTSDRPSEYNVPSTTESNAYSRQPSTYNALHAIPTHKTASDDLTHDDASTEDYHGPSVSVQYFHGPKHYERNTTITPISTATTPETVSPLTMESDAYLHGSRDTTTTKAPYMDPSTVKYISNVEDSRYEDSFSLSTGLFINEVTTSVMESMMSTGSVAHEIGTVAPFTSSTSVGVESPSSVHFDLHQQSSHGDVKPQETSTLSVGDDDRSWNQSTHVTSNESSEEHGYEATTPPTPQYSASTTRGTPESSELTTSQKDKPTVTALHHDTTFHGTVTVIASTSPTHSHYGTTSQEMKSSDGGVKEPIKAQTGSSEYGTSASTTQVHVENITGPTVSKVITPTMKEDVKVPSSTESSSLHTSTIKEGEETTTSVHSQESTILDTTTKQLEPFTEIVDELPSETRGGASLDPIPKHSYVLIREEDIRSDSRCGLVTTVLVRLKKRFSKKWLSADAALFHRWLVQTVVDGFSNTTMNISFSTDRKLRRIPKIVFIRPTPLLKSKELIIAFYVKYINGTICSDLLMPLLLSNKEKLSCSMNISDSEFIDGIAANLIHPETKSATLKILSRYGVVIIALCLLLSLVVVSVCVLLIYNRRSDHPGSNSISDTTHLRDEMYHHQSLEFGDLNAAEVILASEVRQDKPAIINGNRIQSVEDRCWIYIDDVSSTNTNAEVEPDVFDTRL